MAPVDTSRSLGRGDAGVATTFDEVAQAPGQEGRMSGRHLVHALGAGADYLVLRAGSSKGVVLGIRAGVRESPNRTTWTRGGQPIVAGPDAAAGGPYLHLAVGLGGR
jgi:hypothetical protein